jgi:hypothetical protein
MPDGEFCTESDAHVLRTALTAAQAEIGRLTNNDDASLIKQYETEVVPALEATVSRLRCDAQGFHDAAITAGRELGAMRAEVERLQVKNKNAHLLVATVEAERDALAQDAARLDWLEKNAFLITFLGTRAAIDPTREAIDAALSTTTEGRNDASH